MCKCVCVHACVSVYAPQAYRILLGPEGVRSPETEVAASYELSDARAGNQTAHSARTFSVLLTTGPPCKLTLRNLEVQSFGPCGTFTIGVGVVLLIYFSFIIYPMENFN